MPDEIEIEIIKQLQKDGRLSYRYIARKIQVCEGTVRHRIKRLSGENIMKISAVLNPPKLGYNFVCIMGLEVKLADHKQVASTLAKSPNVYHLAFTTGHFDLMAILLFRAAQELSDFVREDISQLPGITRIETFVNMDIIKSPWADALDVAGLFDSEAVN